MLQGLKLMHLPQIIYERIPFVYSAFAAYLFFTEDFWPILVCAGILYCASAMIWVRRSDFRRQTRIKKTLNRFRLPQIVYEYYPFAFIALACLIGKYNSQSWTLGIGLVFLLIAGKNLILRRQSRFNPVKFRSHQS